MNIGFIGLGTMGTPIVLNLLKAGHNVSIHSRNMQSHNVQLATAAGAMPVLTPMDLAKGAEVVMMSLPDPKTTEGVVLGERGVLKGASKGMVIVELSTVPPTTITKLVQHAEPHGVDVLDAPVSGGRVGAEKGELTIMVGGKESVYNKCLPVLKAVGRRIFYVGPSGSGEAVKLINSLVAITNLLVGREALRIAKALKLDLNLLQEIIDSSTGQSWMWSRWIPIILKGREVSSTIALSRKDLDCALGMSKEAGIEAPLAEAALKVLDAATRAQKADLASIFNFLRGTYA